MTGFLLPLYLSVFLILMSGAFERLLKIYT